MAYVPGFEWDLFISYPREINEGDALDFQWVKEFHRLLEKEIKLRLGSSELKIYFDDRDFRATDHLEEDLLEAVRKSALFLPITSRLYVDNKKFTMRELREFCAPGDFKRRIVIVELLPIAVGYRPNELNGPKRNPFFVEVQGKPIVLTPHSGKYRDEYIMRLQFVAEDITAALEGMKDLKEPGPFSEKTILLAQKEEGVDIEWEQIRLFLRKELGVKLLPEGEYPTSDSDLASAITADLAQVDLFVQLLSPEDEAIHARFNPNKPSRSQIQSDLAHARLARPKDQILQWRKPIGTRPEALASWNKALLEGRYVLVGNAKEFKDAIVDKLRPPPQPPPPSSDEPILLIDVAREDLDIGDDLLIKVTDELGENSPWIVKRCPLEGKPEELQAALDENLTDCEALWLIYGQSSATWVDNHLMRCRKLTAKRKAPLRRDRKAILLVPPPRSRDIPWRVERLINLQEGVNAERIRELIRELIG
jgi:hypothetical protein